MNEFKQPYHFIRDNYYGNGGYRYDNSYSYLIQHPRETQEFYNDRKLNSVLENMFQPLQDLFLEPIWATSVDIATQNKDLQTITAQTKLLHASNSSLLDFKLYGKCIFSTYTDISDDGTPDTEVYPEINKVFPADIEKLNMNGLVVDSAIYKEWHDIDDVSVPVVVEYSGNLFSRKTMAWRTPEGKVSLVELDESRRITDYDGFKYGVLNKLGLDLSEVPKTFNLAQIQKQLFNLDTQRLDILRKAGFPILVFMTNGDLTQVSLSVDTIIQIPAGDSETKTEMPEYIELQLEGVSLTSEIIEEKKSTVYKVFTNGLFSDNIKYTSTMSSIIATKSFKSAVDTLFAVYQEIVQTMVDNIVFIYGLQTTYTIDYSEIDFAGEEEMRESAEDILSIN